MIKIIDFYPLKLRSRFVMRTIERIWAIKIVDWLAFHLEFMWYIGSHSDHRHPLTQNVCSSWSALDKFSEFSSTRSKYLSNTIDTT